jgi:hypothetical protein
VGSHGIVKLKEKKMGCECNGIKYSKNKIDKEIDLIRMRKA